MATHSSQFRRNSLSGAGRERVRLAVFFVVGWLLGFAGTSDHGVNVREGQRGNARAGKREIESKREQKRARESERARGGSGRHLAHDLADLAEGLHLGRREGELLGEGAQRHAVTLLALRG